MNTVISPISNPPLFLLHTLFPDAWKLVKGSKRNFWLMVFIIFCLAVIASMLVAFTVLHTIRSWHGLTPFMGLIFVLFAILFIGASLVMFANICGILFLFGIKRARGESVGIKQLVPYLSGWARITIGFLWCVIISLCVQWLSYILVSAVTSLGHPGLMIWPGVTASINYILPTGKKLLWPKIIKALVDLALYPFLFFTFFLIIDRHFSLWSAFIHSIKLGAKYWSKLVLLCVVKAGVVCLFLIPYLGPIIGIISLIWLGPFVIILTGMAYYRIVYNDIPLLRANI